jgi:hypothetical protein
MQLRKGGSDAVIRDNIKTLIKQHRLKGKKLSRKAAVTMAMNKAGKTKLSKKDVRKEAALSLRKKLKMA